MRGLSSPSCHKPFNKMLGTAGSNNTQAIKTMRALRALRPLRTITRVESLRAIVVCFLEAVPMLGSVAGLFFFILLTFSIAGMQIFQSNAFHNICLDKNGEDPSSFPGLCFRPGSRNPSASGVQG